MRDYLPNIIRILYTYPPGSPGLAPALNALCHTAEENGHKEAAAELAQNVCEQLHADSPSGLKCLQCYYAEQGFAEENKVQAEMAAVRATKEEEK